VHFSLLSLFAKPLARIIGISYEIRNKENMVDENESAVLVSNHQSKLDFLSRNFYYKFFNLTLLFAAQVNLSTGQMYLIDDMELVSTAVVASNVFWLGPFGWVLQLCKFGFVKRTPGLQSTYEEINSLTEAVCKEKVRLVYYTV
jgi:hypothetical protein